MSEFFFGKIKLGQISDLVGFSYFILEESLKNKIGIKLGSNIGNNIKYFFKEDPSKEDEILFELMDNPLCSNSHSLFNPDGVTIYVQNVRVDDGSNLQTRMMKVQRFLSGILSSKIVSEIELYINVEKTDDCVMEEINVDRFCETIMEMYAKEKGWIPTIKFKVLNR